MQKKKFTIMKYRDTDNVWIGRVLELPGCHSYGRTPAELQQNLEEAINLCLEDENERPCYANLKVERREFAVHA